MHSRGNLKRGKIRSPKKALPVLFALLVATFLVSLNLGFKQIPIQTIFDALFYGVVDLSPQSTVSYVDRVIIMEIRLPRLIGGILVGSSLGVSGAVLQGIFRNNLAEPYVTGVSSGAAVGGASAIVLGFGVTIFGTAAVSVLAFIGAISAVLLAYNIARVGSRVPVVTLLLSGISVSVFLSAIITLMMVFSGEELRALIFWLLGSLSSMSWMKISVILPPIILAFTIIAVYARDLNVMTLGEDTAHTLGVRVERSKIVLIFAVSLATALAVSVSGIIGFVGLVVPHITRIIFGPDHRVLLPASMMGGAIFLMLCDALARTAFRSVGGIGMELPVGVVTALIGGPLFIYLLRRTKGRYSL